ncbi:hypothetical protein [Actinokineospora fastidiosa]|uniref:Uncharacterized protein n=1 Tax=Actinokineospora fastidiosa TaxID=1816 RepID=A0A918L919_9PSEU|nr:hypothetical protein [Actinokineospora fastidiosa]GGS21559.1 hypothetical protein GCM10010171_12850 [Actinokineospora fastidiosa]
MDEHDLRHAFNQAMADTPPSMDTDAALARAQSAYRRRRTAMMGGGAAAAVAVIAAGAIALTGAAPGGAAPGQAAPAVQPTAAAQSTTAVQPTDAGASTTIATPATGVPPSTRPSWPNGQTDRTASRGPQHARGVELLDLITAALPEGLESPELEWASPEYSGDTRYHQAQYADTINGVEIWEYMATMPVGRDGRYGKLLIEVHTPGNADPTEPCALTTNLWGMGGDCTVVTVEGKQVGLVRKPSADGRFDQWAAYRHPDGTTVAIAQAKRFDGVTEPAMTELPLTTDQLLTLVIADRFAIG